MTYVLLSLALSLGLWTITAQSSDCGPTLAGEQILANRLKIDAAMRATATASEHRILDALVEVLTRLDDAHLFRLSRSLLDVPRTRLDLSANSFFREFPATRTTAAEVQFEAVNDALGDLFNEFTLGMVAAMLPRFPVPGPPSAPMLSGPIGFLRKTVAARFDRVIRPPRFRHALRTLLHYAQQDAEAFNVLTVFTYPNIRTAADGPFEFKDFRTLVQRYDEDRLSPRDKLILTCVLTAFGSGTPSRAEVTHWRENGWIDIEAFGEGQAIIMKREFALESMENIFSEKLGMESRAADASLAVRALMYDEPLPLDIGFLRREILNSAARMTAPLRLRAASARSTSVHLPPTKLRISASTGQALVDHFAPPPPSHRTKTRGVASLPTPVPLKDAEKDAIPDAESLRLFTPLSKVKRALSELSVDVIYKFKFVRGDDEHVERVRFSPAVRSWLIDNPKYAARALKALHLGWSYGRLNGIKYLRSRASSHYEGPIYEIKIYGPFRPLMIQREGVWQMIDVAHKDEIDRAMARIAPLN